MNNNTNTPNSTLLSVLEVLKSSNPGTLKG